MAPELSAGIPSVCACAVPLWILNRNEVHDPLLRPIGLVVGLRGAGAESAVRLGRIRGHP